jgi:Astacin (Peptidase family M12A)
LSLATGCTDSFGVIVHEFMHALGFHHMHTASDRDNYIRINFDNIEESAWVWFGKVSGTDTTSLGVPYDFDSVMHYGRDAYAIDENVATIESLTGEAILPNPNDWTFLDVERINRAYCGKPW